MNRLPYPSMAAARRRARRALPPDPIAEAQLAALRAELAAANARLRADLLVALAKVGKR